jgi:hypothetical protein
MSDSACDGTCGGSYSPISRRAIAVIHERGGERAASAFGRPVNDRLADLPVVAEGIFDAA